MGFEPKLLKKVLDGYDQRRRTKRAQASARREELYRELPRLSEIDAQLSSTMLGIARAALRSGSDPVPMLHAMKSQNLALQQERAQLLARAGFPADYLDETPDCPLCGDTGYILAKPCTCLLKAYAQAQAGELSSLIDIRGQSFESFDFNLFEDDPDPELGQSPRQNIEIIYDICADFAHTFGARSKNLFISGKPGRGKTYLSGCIAGEVSKRGCSVVYDTAIHIFDRFEAERFGHDIRAGEDTRRYLCCDLLIIDDLGTEFSSPFSVSALYHIVNTRLISGKKTIINSNLTNAELNKRYSPQIVSRLDGEYITLYLIGEDLRLKQRFDRGYEA